MRLVRLSASAIVLALIGAGSARADVLTLGSTLEPDASITLAQGADTAYWLMTRDAAEVRVPVDGQVTRIRIKGAAMSEPGAGPPASMVHFQTLGPEAPDGSRTVDLTSAFTDMPIDDPARITTFDPENLCVRSGGAVAFNTIGGFGWNGGDPSAPNPIDPAHYRQGTPWRIFGRVAGSTTGWYSRDNGTRNGDRLTPAGGTGAAEGYGRTEQGTELLMQVVVATGDDRSQSCGGPARHPDGSVVAPKVRELRVAGGTAQRPYVTRDRRFSTGVYCETPGEACRGRAVLRIARRTLAVVPVVVGSQSAHRVPMRLPAGDFRRLDRLGSLRVTFVLVSQFGRRTSVLQLKR